MLETMLAMRRRRLINHLCNHLTDNLQGWHGDPVFHGIVNQGSHQGAPRDLAYPGLVYLLPDGKHK